MMDLTIAGGRIRSRYREKFAVRLQYYLWSTRYEFEPGAYENAPEHLLHPGRYLSGARIDSKSWIRNSLRLITSSREFLDPCGALCRTNQPSEVDARLAPRKST